MSKRIIPASTRAIVLDRDLHQCQYADCKLREENDIELNLHHIYPERYGGTEEPNNLITLCKAHHKAMHVQFHGYYGDSTGVMEQIRRFFRRALFGVGLGSDPTLVDVLAYLTGSRKFRDGQEQVIRDILNGHDVLFVTPTSAGKSACYQIPGIILPQQTLVITPLKALMANQTQSLLQKIVPATFINSDVGEVDRKRRMSWIVDGLVKFVFLTPERFFPKGEPYQGPLLKHYDLLAVDEAHCIDKWGRSFRPSYARLGELRQALSSPPTLAITASASKQVQTRVKASLGIQNAKTYVTGFKRDNIELKSYVIKPHGLTKYAQLEVVLAVRRTLKTLIFVPTINVGKDLLAHLNTTGYEARFFHSELDTAEKTELQNRFTGIAKPKLQILIATSAFGMGIDIPDIRLVVHWGIPANIEDYYQQFGRAGRDGRAAEAILIYRPGDEGVIRFLSQKGREANQRLTSIERTKLYEIEEDELLTMLEYVEADNKWDYILNYFGDDSLLSGPWRRYLKRLMWPVLVPVILAAVALAYLLGRYR